MAYLAVLGPAADCCTGDTFVALVPHPDEWRDGQAVDVALWRRLAGNWLPF